MTRFASKEWWEGSKAYTTVTENKTEFDSQMPTQSTPPATRRHGKDRDPCWLEFLEAFCGVWIRSEKGEWEKRIKRQEEPRTYRENFEKLSTVNGGWWEQGKRAIWLGSFLNAAVTVVWWAVENHSRVLSRGQKWYLWGICLMGMWMMDSIKKVWKRQARDDKNLG